MHMRIQEQHLKKGHIKFLVQYEAPRRLLSTDHSKHATPACFLFAGAGGGGGNPGVMVWDRGMNG